MGSLDAVFRSGCERGSRGRSGAARVMMGVTRTIEAVDRDAMVM